MQGPTLNVARVAQDGRMFESDGEDPYITSVMGVADIDGIQSQGVMAEAKHLGVDSQEEQLEPALTTKYPYGRSLRCTTRRFEQQ